MSARLVFIVLIALSIVGLAGMLGALLATVGAQEHTITASVVGARHDGNGASFQAGMCGLRNQWIAPASAGAFFPET